jgi:hypothetical protein
MALVLLSPDARGQTGPDANKPRLDPKRPLKAIYQPGQTMNLFVKCLREPWRKRGSTPRSRWISYCGYRILDPAARLVSQVEVKQALPFAGVTVSYRIPQKAPSGMYRLVTEMRGPGIRGTSAVSYTFQVVARPGAPRVGRREDDDAAGLAD